jgi:hypothetical protein
MIEACSTHEREMRYKNRSLGGGEKQLEALPPVYIFISRNMQSVIVSVLHFKGFSYQ